MPKSRLTRGLRDQIAIELRQDIVAGRFASGMQMVERQLAQRFGVSHAPIREALLQLSHEGLLVSHTNRGAQVAPLLEPALRTFFMSLRMSLECHALQLALPDLSDSDLAAWDETLRQLEAARAQQDVAAIAELDFAFHQSIICAAAQGDVESAWRSIVARARVYVGEWLKWVDNWPAQEQAHAEVVTYCRERNLEAALQALRSNIRAEMQSIEGPSGAEPAAAHRRTTYADDSACSSRDGKP